MRDLTKEERKQLKRNQRLFKRNSLYCKLRTQEQSLEWMKEEDHYYEALCQRFERQEQCYYEREALKTGLDAVDQMDEVQA